MGRVGCRAWAVYDIHTGGWTCGWEGHHQTGTVSTAWGGRYFAEIDKAEGHETVGAS